MSKNEVFWHFLENAWKLMAEISYLDSSQHFWTRPIGRQKSPKIFWGPFMLKNGVFWEYLENASELLAENSYLDSSWQDNSNDVWLSYPENHFDPFLGHIPDIPGPNFGSKFFFCFFSRIESFWCQKWKKIFFWFLPIGGHPRWGDRIFLGQEVRFFFWFFLIIKSFWCQKSNFRFLHMGHPRGW